MKVLLYLENRNSLSNSGIGRALDHQAAALKSAGLDFTFDPNDTYDLAHINSYGPKSYRLLRKCHARGIKVIVHGHSTHQDFRDSFRNWQLMAPFYDAWMDRMYAFADLIITPTNYSKKCIEGIRNVTCPVLAVSNGLKLEDYAPNPEYQKNFKDKFQIGPNDKVIVGAGFYFRRKGIDDFFEVARKLPGFKFIWFGSLQKILTQSYIQSCLRHKPDNVILPGYIAGSIIKGAYQSASCMLFPTREETEGIVALEALASRLPLITRDIPVYKDWLTDGVNCYKRTDISGFKSAVEQCIISKQDALVEEGYKVAEARSIDKIGLQLKKAYLDLLETTI
jgi:1,2-diacylglycerol-3-alpha-glucose alpha-1,2-glucosyltransferase